MLSSYLTRLEDFNRVDSHITADVHLIAYGHIPNLRSLDFDLSFCGLGIITDAGVLHLTRLYKLTAWYVFEGLTSPSCKGALERLV